MRITSAPIITKPYITGQYTKEYSNQSHFAQVLAQTITLSDKGVIRHDTGKRTSKETYNKTV